MKRILSFIFVSFMGLFLMACTQNLPKYVTPELTFEHIKPVRLNVMSVIAKDAYQPPLVKPYIEHELKTPLYTVALGVGQHTLEADNQGGADNNLILRYIVEEASLKEDITETKTQISSLFGTKSSRKYAGRIRIALELSDDQGNAMGTGKTIVTRGLSIPDHYTVQQRDRALFNMSEHMADDLHQALIELIKSKFFILLD